VREPEPVVLAEEIDDGLRSLGEQLVAEREAQR
jgi:hypothetical protein